jgi:tetratricopeptide (TPR) repeat protein
MNRVTIEEFTRRPVFVLVALLIIAALGFWGVGRLVNRFGEQKKALGRHLFAQSALEQKEGKSEQAIEDLRAALDYNPDNFDYQLSLARLLRDTDRTPEAEAYLISLWERDPQNGAVNLALARLFARKHDIEKAIQYYHNAAYGVWPQDAEVRRRDTRLELIRFLLQEKDYPQAQAELIGWSSVLPSDPKLELTLANLFAAAHDYDHALMEYQQVLRKERGNAEALAGAGAAAYQLGRYRTAADYLQAAARANPNDSSAKQQLQTTEMILKSDPNARGISNTERNQRVKTAFLQAGARLDNCNSTAVQSKGRAPASDLASLKQNWLSLKPQVTRLYRRNSADVRDSAMDLVFNIEQKTEQVCGTPTGLDEALLLLAQNPTGVDR